LRQTIGALICTACVVGAIAVARTHGHGTTYAGESTFLALCFAVAGASLIACGIAARSRQRLISALAITAGVAWFGPAWEGWNGGPALVRSLGLLVAVCSFPILVHLALTPLGTNLKRPVAALVAATYAVCGLCALAIVVVRDPYLDPFCWSNCSANTFVVASRPALARRLNDALRFANLGASAVLVVACLVDWRRIRFQRAIGGVLIGLSTGAYVVERNNHPLESPADHTDARLFVLRALAVIALAIGLSTVLLRTRRQRRQIADIVRALDPSAPPGAVGAALANAVGDPTLAIAYPLTGTDRFVDGTGRSVRQPGANGRTTTTTLRRDGMDVAVVSHDVDVTDLERALGSTLRLAIDNERLQAEVHARLNELTASRARIVVAGDARRRTLERDLHDGAQQRLLTLAYEVQAARSDAVALGATGIVALVDEAITEVAKAFDGLRELAHGIFPAVLATMGLGVSVAELADACPVAVNVESTLGTTRFDPMLEAAAYDVAAAGLEIVERSGAPGASITLARQDGVLIVDVAVRNDPHTHTEELLRLTDRVGAVGGRLICRSDGFVAELPCES